MAAQDNMISCWEQCPISVRVPLGFWQKVCILFKMASFSGSNRCQDGGSEFTTELLRNLASSASPRHRAPIHCLSPRWNDSSNSPGLQRRGGLVAAIKPPPLTHTLTLDTNTHTHTHNQNKIVLALADHFLWLHSCSHLVLTGCPRLSNKQLLCVAVAIQAAPLVCQPEKLYIS